VQSLAPHTTSLAAQRSFAKTQGVNVIGKAVHIEKGRLLEGYGVNVPKTTDLIQIVQKSQNK
jgi:hypothetical protein